MELFKKIIEILAMGSIAFGFVNVYLTINKLWKRKHLQVVADSQSLVGRFVAITANSLMAFDAIVLINWLGVVERSGYIFMNAVQVLIGAGLWVARDKKKNVWQLIRQALRAERKEVAELAKSVFRPSNAEHIIDILTQVAAIDQVLDKREKMFIQAFADSWSIKISWPAIEKIMGDSDFSYDRLRQDMLDYLKTEPPAEQATQLGDLITMLVNVDNEVSEEEELILAELTGLIGNYVNKDALQSLFNVAVIPQSPQQIDRAEEALKDAKKGKIAGGQAYFTGPFYSLKYAEIVCGKYRAMGFFSIPVDLKVAS